MENDKKIVRAVELMFAEFSDDYKNYAVFPLWDDGKLEVVCRMNRVGDKWNPFRPYVYSRDSFSFDLFPLKLGRLESLIKQIAEVLGNQAEGVLGKNHSLACPTCGQVYKEPDKVKYLKYGRGEEE